VNVQVLGFLDAEDLSAVGLVCKRFYLITDESRYLQPLLVLIICVVGSFSFIAPALSFLFESLWKKAYGELVPQQFALSQCDDYKAECKKWLRLHLSSEWCATSASLLSLSVHLFGPLPHIHLSRLTANTGTARRARRVGGVSIVRATTRIGSMTASSEWPSSAMWGRARYLAWIPFHLIS
jgi:hypothetical protein